MRQALRNFTRYVMAGMLTALETMATAAAVNFTPIDFPGATSTIPEGINDAGQIVGQFSESPSFTLPFSGFLYSDGRFEQD